MTIHSKIHEFTDPWKIKTCMRIAHQIVQVIKKEAIRVAKQKSGHRKPELLTSVITRHTLGYV